MQALPQGSCRSVQELQVLLVDRDASLTTVLQMPLRKAGFSVSTARTAREAARILEEKRQDAVVLDPSLPDGEANELFERLGRASHAVLSDQPWSLSPAWTTRTRRAGSV